jgi:hypothetical protein
MKNILVASFLIALAFGSVANAGTNSNPGQRSGARTIKQLTITVQNTLEFDRTEVVGITSKKLTGLLGKIALQDIRIKKNGSSDFFPLQWMDYDGDGKLDELLFKPEVKAKSVSRYTLLVDGRIAEPQSALTTYSRFVPERTDDYAWENDKVAFRTYGPDAQMRIEKNVPGGTLSSGIDIWLKRTSAPVINKWYKGYLTDQMFYHNDHGEGYDPYHVGASRGTGGTGVWEKDTLLVSRNFITYKTIAIGPLRTVFELTYAPYSSFKVKEIKRISLDLGSNFSKFEVSYVADQPLPNYTIGITLHEKRGNFNIDTTLGVFIHHEEIDRVYVGEALIFDPASVTGAFAHKPNQRDQSNLLVLTNPTGKINYYAGFAWAKSGQVNSPGDWEKMVHKQSVVLMNPLKVKVNN